MKKGVVLLILAFFMGLFISPGGAFASQEGQGQSSFPQSPINLHNVDVSKKVKISKQDVPFNLPKLQAMSQNGKTRLTKQDYFLLHKEEMHDGKEYYLIEVSGTFETIDDDAVSSGGTKGETVVKNYQNKVSGSQTTWIEVTGTHLDPYVRIIQMQYQWQRSDPRYTLKNAKAVAQMWGQNESGTIRQYRWDNPVSPSFNPQGFSQTFNSYDPMRNWNPIKTTGLVCFTSTLADIYDGGTKLVDRVDFQCFLDVHNWWAW